MAAKIMNSRYYCTKNPTHRVYPYDSVDLALGVEAPVLGKSGEAVLLSTLNSRVDVKKGELKWAWCWADNTFVQCIRRTQAEVRASYLNRNGIVVRNRRR